MWGSEGHGPQCPGRSMKVADPDGPRGSRYGRPQCSQCTDASPSLVGSLIQECRPNQQRSGFIGVPPQRSVALASSTVIFLDARPMICACLGPKVLRSSGSKARSRGGVRLPSGCGSDGPEARQPSAVDGSSGLGDIAAPQRHRRRSQPTIATFDHAERATAPRERGKPRGDDRSRSADALALAAWSTR